MYTLNAKNFFNKFTNIESNENVKLKYFVNIQNKSSRKIFTDAVINYIAVDVVNACDNSKNDHEKLYYKSHCSKEYYNIDLLIWRRLQEDSLKAEAKSLNLNHHLWVPEIAIEHENDEKDWSDEVIKLLYINAPLRVIIGYSESAGADEKRLKYVAACINKLYEYTKRSFLQINDEFLIILGNCNNPIPFNYRAYLLEQSDNEPINIYSFKNLYQ